MITPQEILPTLKQIQKFIGDDNRASDDSDDETPSVCVTVATTTGEEWNYQTGDNSYTGGAYGLQHWSVQTITRDTDCEELAGEIVDELLEMVRWTNGI